MTLIEMMAAVGILLLMTGIISRVFYQATKASSRGKALGEIYQVTRALETVIARDLSGATPDFFASGENSRYVKHVWPTPPPGPYSSTLSGAPFSDADMTRMTMGGSDFLVFTSTNAAGNYRGVAKVFYVLRASGELVRVAYPDTTFNFMDYLRDPIMLDTAEKRAVYDERHVVAENVEAFRVSFLDRSTGAISEDGPAHAYGVWRENWDWNEKAYLPAAVKIELQVVDNNWVINDGDNVSNKKFDPTWNDDNIRASENFDPDDGENFRIVVNIPLGMN
jgi:type II secretory pathway pseudopilin PulG